MTPYPAFALLIYCFVQGLPTPVQGMMYSSRHDWLFAYIVLVQISLGDGPLYFNGWARQYFFCNGVCTSHSLGREEERPWEGGSICVNRNAIVESHSHRDIFSRHYCQAFYCLEKLFTADYELAINYLSF